MMDDLVTAYYLAIAAAFVRGQYRQNPDITLPDSLLCRSLNSLSVDEQRQIFDIGREAGFRLHRFKRSLILPRVKWVLSRLRGIHPITLLDIGSGRGAFLWPLLDSFPALPVTAIDASPQRAKQLKAVELGGVEQLSAHHMSATNLTFSDRQFDVVTMLEVLEHIPNANLALAEVVRVARRFVILSVPSREDNNPEHIHHFTQDELCQMYGRNGIRRIKFDYVHNHMMVMANVGKA